ncbi:MAG: GatB/YqeY domain-containing protein [Nitrospinales bacterium]
MSLLNRIKEDLLRARKAKDQKLTGILSTLYAESMMIGKNDGNRETTDAEVVGKIRGFIKNIDETLKALSEDHPNSADLREEKSAIARYLPQQLSADQLKNILLEIAAGHEKSMKSMGAVMAELKEKHPGEYDGKLASQIVREILKP